MNDKKASYEELLERLGRAEATLDSLARGEVDLVIGVKEPLVVRLRQVAEEKERLGRLLEAMMELAPTLIVLTDAEGRILLFNRASQELTGYSSTEVQGKTIAELFLPTDLSDAPAARFADPSDPALMEPHIIPWITRTGEERLIEWRRTAIESPEGDGHFVMSVGLDVTEHKRAEEEGDRLRAQFWQAQKMEAVGRLASGVAHDFNNLLTGIKGFAGFALQAAGPGSQAYEDLTEVLALADNAAGLTQQLLAFSRRQTLEPVVLNLNELIADLSRMLTRLLGEDIDLQFLPAADLGNVRADPGQVEQVLMNLALNARDAMPTGGRLTIETANVELGEEYAAKHVSVVPGPYVMVGVSDTGCGMDEATQQRLFEPFFTTKKDGKGTGLGLSSVYGIVKQHDGNIWVYSEPGKGTTFKIYLPRVAAEVSERHPSPEFVTGGAETILLVEDNDAVRDVGRRHLEGLGYTVLCASGPGEAEGVAQRHEGHIDLLLTDVVMPGKSGRELYESLRAQQPDLRVLYMSGYTGNAIVHHGVLEGGTLFLQKPFERKALADKVRQALEA